MNDDEIMSLEAGDIIRPVLEKFSKNPLYSPKRPFKKQNETGILKYGNPLIVWETNEDADYVVFYCTYEENIVVLENHELFNYDLVPKEGRNTLDRQMRHEIMENISDFVTSLTNSYKKLEEIYNEKKD